MVSVVGVFGHLALRFLVERHVVREGLGAADLDAAKGSLGVERPALFVLAVVSECAAPGVLHDPESLAVLVVAPADALDSMASFRSTLACLRLVDAGSDVEKMFVDGYADCHRALLDQVGLDLCGGGQSVDVPELARAAHFFGFEFAVAVVESAPARGPGVVSASAAERVREAVVGVDAEFAFRLNLVAEGAFAEALARTDFPLAQRVRAAAVAVGVALFGGESVVHDLLQSSSDIATFAQCAFGYCC